MAVNLFSIWRSESAPRSAFQSQVLMISEDKSSIEFCIGIPLAQLSKSEITKLRKGTDVSIYQTPMHVTRAKCENSDLAGSILKINVTVPREVYRTDSRISQLDAGSTVHVSPLASDAIRYIPIRRP